MIHIGRLVSAGFVSAIESMTPMEPNPLGLRIHADLAAFKKEMDSLRPVIAKNAEAARRYISRRPKTVHPAPKCGYASKDVSVHYKSSVVTSNISIRKIKVDDETSATEKLLAYGADRCYVAPRKITRSWRDKQEWLSRLK